MSIDYISHETTPLYKEQTGRSKKIELLWGDRVRIIRRLSTRTEVQARGVPGFVKNEALGGKSLLEIYFIDVGQGDGILIRTPDHRHILIDGGYNRAKQPTGKNAADFVDWKFASDYEMSQIELDAMIASHCDADHYGGLWDLINPEESYELNLSDVRVETFCHAGIGWWKDPRKKRWLGPYESDGTNAYLTRLMGGRSDALQALRHDNYPRLQGEWADFIRCVTKTHRKDGGYTRVHRLSHIDRFVPGFDPDSTSATLKVLAPVEFDCRSSAKMRQICL